MCGLFGALSSGLKDDEVELVQQLGIVSVIRGNAGAGVAIVPKKPKNEHTITLKKGDWNAADLMCSTDFYRETHKKKLSSIIGHARMPTKGNNTTSHAHPFIIKNLVGAHNGTIDKIDGRKIKHDESDSELLFEAIVDKGIGVLNVVEGAYCLSYVDKEKDTLNFIRNSLRPMYFGGFKEAPGTLYWASEHGMLTFLLGRKPAGTPQMWKLEPGQLYSFPLHFEGEVCPKIEEVIKDRPKTSVPTIITGADAFGRQAESDYGHQRYLTFPPITLSYDELMDALNNGCEMCRHPAIIDDWRHKKLTWFKQDAFMCQECMDTDEMARAWAQQHGVVLPVRSHAVVN